MKQRILKLTATSKDGYLISTSYYPNSIEASAAEERAKAKGYNTKLEIEYNGTR